MTHVDCALWPAFLRLFERSLTPGGVVVFTAYGLDRERDLRSGTNRLNLTPEAVGCCSSSWTVMVRVTATRTWWGLRRQARMGCCSVAGDAATCDVCRIRLAGTGRDCLRQAPRGR